MAAVIGRGLSRSVGDRSCSQSPFLAYYIVVISLNSVAIIGGAISQFDLHQGQSRWYGYDRCDGWLFTNGMFGVLHILGALYIVKKIQEPEDAEPMPMDYQLHQGQQQQQQQQQQQPKQFGRNNKNTRNNEPVIQGHVIGEQWDDEAGQEFDKPVIASNSQKSMGPPESWPRIKHVLCENFMVAIYFLIYLIYLAWHFFVEQYPCNEGMRFAQRTADIFIMAAPCSFAFSVITMMMQKRQL